MSCILYPMGAYLQLATAETFKSCALAVGREPFAFASELFELNARAYLHRYGDGPHGGEIMPEIAEARADMESDGEFSDYLKAEASEPGESFLALHDLLRRVRYQCSDADDYETSTDGTALELAVVWAATEHADPARVAKRDAEARETARAAASERERLRAEAIGRGKAILDAARPAWAVAAIVAELEVDKCDTQSDYFATSTARTVFLAWSKHTRDLFSEMRKAAALMPETAHLGPGKGLFTPRVVLADTFYSNGANYRAGEGSHWHRELYGEFDPPTFSTRAEAEAFIKQAGEPEPINFTTLTGPQLVTFGWEISEGEVEHREKYSMGAGYYLKAGGTYSSGWTVSKVKFYDGAIPESLYEAAGLPGGIVTPPEAPKAKRAESVDAPSEVAADVTRDGDRTWISFPAKPPQSVIDRLKTAGARWSRKRQAWYFSRAVDLAEVFPGAHPEPVTLACGTCGRSFSDESAELAADMLEAHKQIAHREPEPFIPDEHKETARVLAYRPRAEFRASLPEDEPDPDGAAKAETSPTGQQAQAAGASEPCAHAETHLSEPGETSDAGLIQFESCVACGEVWEIAPRSILPPWPVKGTVTRETLRALKLINDAAVLAEKQKPDQFGEVGSTYGSDRLARVRLGDVETVLNVVKVGRWAATFERGDSFTFELTPHGLTLTRGTSFVRFVGGTDIPGALDVIELSVSESGEIIAPALPSLAEMKAARKSLAEGRKALAAERKRQNALKGVNSARADVRRAEEYAARLEAEARETIARAEELTEGQCDEAVTLAKRVRDLRRLRRSVEQACEDPQVNTPEFFDWLTDEHRAAYAEAFPELEKAERRGWRKKAEAARKGLAAILRRGFDEHTAPEVERFYPEEACEYGTRHAAANIFSRRFDIEPQVIKRALRRFPGRIERARAGIAKAREALESFAPHVHEDDRALAA